MDVQPIGYDAFWWWPGFEPQTLHELCIVSTNCAKCNNPIFVRFILIVFMRVYICLHVIICLWVHFDGFSC